MFNILKNSVVTISEEVYTVPLKMPEIVQFPVTPHREQGESEEPERNGMSAEEEEAIWNRLKARLEEERKAILKEAHEEAGFIRNQAYQEGYQKGLSEKAAELGALVASNERILRDMNQMFQTKLQEYEENLSMLSLEIASKVLGLKLDQNDELLIPLIRNTVDEVKNAKWITVTLSDQLKLNLRELEQELQNGRATGSVDIVQKSVPKGTCIVETPDGVIDSSILTQLENLKQYFQ